MTLIKREDAIEAVKHRLYETAMNNMEHGDVYVDIAENRIGTWLSALPSAELTLQTPQTYGKSINPSNAEVVEDLISRADAIEAIQNAYCKPCKERGDDHNEVRCRACAFDDAIIQIDALPSAEAETVDCTDFIRWLTETVMDDGMWELNAVAYGEVIARKLTKLGVLEVKDDVYVYKPSAEVRTKCVAQIKVDTEEIVRRIKEEYDITDRWIPCSERLPEKDGWYLVTVQGYETVTDVAPFNYELWKGLASHQEVIAWMPLPMPYREDGEV